MKAFGYLALGALAMAGAGCAARFPEPRQPSMVRSFQGRLVPGYFVSPAAYQHYIQAQLYANDGRAEESVDELRHALASDGASPYLRSRLAEELLSLGRVDEAREEIDAALHLDPEFPEGYVDLARVKLRVGDAGGAEESLKRALQLDRTCEEAYVALVGLYRERGQDSKLEDVWRQMARNVPNAASAHHALGRLAEVRGDLAGAEAEYRKALDLDGGLEDARVELAALLQGDGRSADASAELRQAYERSGDAKLVERIVRLEMASGHTDEAHALIDRLEDEGGQGERRLFVGWLRITAKQPERALVVADEVLKAGESGGARLLSASAFEALGRSDDAIAELRKVPRDAHLYAKAQERLAQLLRDSGRYGEAIDLVGKVLVSIAGDPAGADATDSLQGVLAGIHERAGDHLKAIDVLKKALAKRPTSEALAFALGNAYVRGGDWLRAVDTVQSVLKRDPDSVQALNFIGYTLVDHGARLDDARKLLLKAASLKPEDGAVVDSLGWLYVKLNRLDEAERLLVRADRLAPEDPEILGHLGELYLRKADRGRALDTYRRALKQHPEEHVRRVLEEQILLLETGRVGSR